MGGALPYERVERLLPVIVNETEVVSHQSRQAPGRTPDRLPKTTRQFGEIEALITRVEQYFAEAAEREVPSHELGHYVLSCMKELDEVAYVRFASVYREFTDVGQFMLNWNFSRTRAQRQENARATEPMELQPRLITCVWRSMRREMSATAVEARWWGV